VLVYQSEELEFKSQYFQNLKTKQKKEPEKFKNRSSFSHLVILPWKCIQCLREPSQNGADQLRRFLSFVR
jgi:hypothetical protein